YRARDRLQVGGAALQQQQREEVDLEQQVSELVGELRIVTADGCVRNLVRLFDRVRDDRPLRLLAIPRTVTAQPLSQRLQLNERLGEAQLTASRSSSSSAWCRDPDSA